jgi:hypothetical protein
MNQIAEVTNTLQAMQHLAQILEQQSHVAQDTPGPHASAGLIVTAFQDAASAMNTMLITLSTPAMTGAQVRQGAHDGQRITVQIIHGERDSIFQVWRDTAAQLWAEHKSWSLRRVGLYIRNTCPIAKPRPNNKYPQYSLKSICDHIRDLCPPRN